MEGEHHQHKQGAMVMQLKGKLKQDAAHNTQLQPTYYQPDQDQHGCTLL